MSVAGATDSPLPTERTRPQRRVREDVIDGLAVVVFSAVASSAAAVALLVLTALVG